MKRFVFCLILLCLANACFALGMFETTTDKHVGFTFYIFIYFGKYGSGSLMEKRKYPSVPKAKTRAMIHWLALDVSEMFESFSTANFLHLSSPQTHCPQLS
jgi:hypothetical protein